MTVGNTPNFALGVRQRCPFPQRPAIHLPEQYRQTFPFIARHTVPRAGAAVALRPWAGTAAQDERCSWLRSSPVRGNKWEQKCCPITPKWTGPSFVSCVFIASCGTFGNSFMDRRPAVVRPGQRFTAGLRGGRLSVPAMIRGLPAGSRPATPAAPPAIPRRH